jgi:Skp family chaperone for outer membrane proteins
MRSLKTLVVLSVAVFAVCLVLAGGSSAQSMKIGYVKDDVIKQNYKAWAKAQEQWETEKKAWDTEAQARQDELQQMAADYEKQRLILSTEKKNEREAAIRAKQEALDAFTRQIYGPDGTAEKKQAELLNPLLETLSKAIEAVANDGGYDVIFTMQSGLGYIKPTYDVTQKVLDYLEKIDK